jgi:hypothetical protein
MRCIADPISKSAGDRRGVMAEPLVLEECWSSRLVTRTVRCRVRDDSASARDAFADLPATSALVGRR